jgi:putative endonuclease
VQEWLNWHAWKACVPQNGTGGSNPPLSAERGKMSYFAYILKSEYDGTYYYGSTKNLRERLKTHNSGKSRYTKGRRPWKIHYFGEYSTRSEAVQREKFFKSIDGFNFLKERKII